MHSIMINEEIFSHTQHLRQKKINAILSCLIQSINFNLYERNEKITVMLYKMYLK